MEALIIPSIASASLFPILTRNKTTKKANQQPKSKTTTKANKIAKTCKNKLDVHILPSIASASLVPILTKNTKQQKHKTPP